MDCGKTQPDAGLGYQVIELTLSELICGVGLAEE